MGQLQRNPETPPAASRQNHPRLRRRERISLVKNRMREIRTSGSVRDGGGDVPIYSALGVVGRRQMTAERRGLMQLTIRGEEVQLASAKCLVQVVQEQSSKQARQYLDRKKVSVPARD